MTSKAKSSPTIDPQQFRHHMRTSLDCRVPLEKLAALQKDLQSGQHFSTKSLVDRHGLGRSTVNAIRQLLRERPDLANAVFSDKLSLFKAAQFLREDVHDIPKAAHTPNGNQPATGLAALAEGDRRYCAEPVRKASIRTAGSAYKNAKQSNGGRLNSCSHNYELGNLTGRKNWQHSAARTAIIPVKQYLLGAAAASLGC
jgi:hypothetical protein